MKNKQILCPECNSKEVIKRGILKTENKGKRQRYGCKKCDHRFIKDEPFFRMRNNKKIITLCFDLYYKGLSFKKIQKHLKAFHPNEVSYSTIYRWILKYVNVMANFTDKQKIQLGLSLEGDEVEFHRRKYHTKKGVEKNWFIDIIDTETRFLVLSKYVKNRTPEELKIFYREVKKKTGNQTKIISTDGLKIYRKALKRTFGLRTFRERETPTSEIIHRVVKSDSGKFNYKIERFHSTLRERTKIMRGFHGCISSAQTLLKGFEIYYNYVREHTSLKGLSPSELAIPDLKFKDNNRWLELIERGYNES